MKFLRISENGWMNPSIVEVIVYANDKMFLYIGEERSEVAKSIKCCGRS